MLYIHDSYINSLLLVFLFSTAIDWLNPRPRLLYWPIPLDHSPFCIVLAQHRFICLDVLTGRHHWEMYFEPWLSSPIIPTGLRHRPWDYDLLPYDTWLTI
jgi:hypothetical protein